MKNKNLRQEFDQSIITKGKITIIHFIATWSGKCQLSIPAFEKLSNLYESKAGFYTVDIEKNAKMVNTYHINELPHVLFFKNGELVDQAIGNVPAGLLEKKIQKII